jgi:ABC-2 type transport system permease protein
MAEVNRELGIGTQVRLVMWLRWRLFRNSLRKSTARMNFIMTVVTETIWGLMAIGSGVGLIFAGYFLADAHRTGILTIIVWAFAFFWQFIPIITAQFAPDFDISGLLRFPLRFPVFFALSVSYGLADPIALTCVFWHICLGIGISIARPDLAGWVILILGGSILMNLLFNRMMFTWLDRLLARRRTREIMVVVFTLFIIGMQFSQFLFRQEGMRIANTVSRWMPVLTVLPPGRVAAGLVAAFEARSADALTAAGGVLLYAVAFAGFYTLRLRAKYRGEDLGESAAPSVRKPARVRPATPAAVAAAPAGGMHLLRAPVAAILSKDIRYFYRNTAMLMNLIIPLILIVFFRISAMNFAGRSAPHSSIFTGDFGYPFSMFYVFLLTSQLCQNSLAYEGRGIERLFLSPIPFRDVMLAKNIFQAMLIALEALFVLAIILLLGPPPRLPILLATWAGVPLIAIINFIAGNWLSIQFPRKFEFGVRRQSAAGMTILISMGILLGTAGIIAAASALTIYFAGLWLLPVVLLAMSAAMVAVYRMALGAVSRQALLKQDALLEQLAK